MPEPARTAAPVADGSRRVLDPATAMVEDAAVFERAALTPGAHLDGPALIVEDETTTVVPRGWTAHINNLRQIVLELPT